MKFSLSYDTFNASSDVFQNAYFERYSVEAPVGETISHFQWIEHVIFLAFSTNKMRKEKTYHTTHIRKIIFTHGRTQTEEIARKQREITEQKNTTHKECY